MISRAVSTQGQYLYGGTHSSVVFIQCSKYSREVSTQGQHLLKGSSLRARPSKNQKQGSGKRGGVEVCTAELLNLAKPVEFSAEPGAHTSILSFLLGVCSFLKQSKMRRRFSCG